MKDKCPEPPKPILSSKGREPSPETKTPPQINQSDNTRKDEGKGSGEQGGQSSSHSPGKNNTSREDVGGSHPDGDNSRAPIPAPPQDLTNCFSREEVMNEVFDLMDQDASVALFGSIGVGKSFVALTLLHHDRTRVKFGSNRHFMHCGDLPNSLEGFLERLSDAIHTNRTTDLAQLRSHLQTSPPFILVLDGVDLILDSPTPGAEDISAAIEEFGGYDNVCLVTTSRMYPDIHGFHRVEVPTFSKEGAQDAFYGICNLDRSPAVDDLIARLDFHPLSIHLLADFARGNGRDESMLLKAWDDGQTSALEGNYHRTLRDTVEPVFRFPTIQKLGTTAREALAAIAAFPSGVEECRLKRMFPRIAGIAEAVDVLCRFSLIYRQDGHVKMLSPFRYYFTMSMLEPAQCTEIIHWDASYRATEACTSFPLLLCDGQGKTS